MANYQSELTSLLRTISRSFSVQALQSAPLKFESNRDRITYLAGLGHSAEDIAAILGIGAKNVTNRVAEAKLPEPKRKRRG